MLARLSGVGLGDALFVQEAQHRLIETLEQYAASIGSTTAQPLYGVLPPTESQNIIKGHQTSQSFLRDAQPTQVDVLRFDLLADDLAQARQQDDPILMTWLVLWMLYVSDVTKAHVTSFTQPALASSYFDTFDERMALYVTGSIDYTNRNASEIVTCEAATAVSKEWHIYEQLASLHGGGCK